MASYVVSGLGFLGTGAGVIAHEEASMHGLNTAAALWCVAAVGVLSGVRGSVRGVSCPWSPTSPILEPSCSKKPAAKGRTSVHGTGEPDRAGTTRVLGPTRHAVTKRQADAAPAGLGEAGVSPL